MHDILRNHRLQFSNTIEFLSLKIFSALPNSIDNDEISHPVAFHLDLHCLLAHAFRIQ